MRRWAQKRITGSNTVESASWVLAVISMVLLVVVGVVVKPDPPPERYNIEQILKQIKNQQRESKDIDTLRVFEKKNSEIGEVKKKIIEFGVNVEELSETVRVIPDFKQRE
jgi:hypothetical protein